MRQRTVITGGAGFIGSHLCDYFIGKGHEVVCVDSLLTGTARNVEHLFGHERFASSATTSPSTSTSGAD